MRLHGEPTAEQWEGAFHREATEVCMTSFGTVVEAAARLRCDANHVYYLIYIGELYAVKVRWIYRVDMSTVEDYDTRRAAARAGKLAACYSEHPGYLFDPACFAFNGPARIEAPRRASGLHGGRGVERNALGFPQVPVEKRHAVARPVQYELAIA